MESEGRNEEYSVRTRPWPAKTPQEIRERFERFWLHYPRRVSVKQAMAAFEKLSPTEELLGAMTEALKWQVVDWETRERTDGGDWRSWVPHPSTWINGFRWLDEMPDRVRRIVEGRRKAAARAEASEARRQDEDETPIDEAELARGEEIRRQARERIRTMTAGIGKP